MPTREYEYLSRCAIEEAAQAQRIATCPTASSERLPSGPTLRVSVAVHQSPTACKRAQDGIESGGLELSRSNGFTQSGPECTS